jgi:hypothetical protein
LRLGPYDGPTLGPASRSILIVSHLWPAPGSNIALRLGLGIGFVLLQFTGGLLLRSAAGILLRLLSGILFSAPHFPSLAFARHTDGFIGLAAGVFLGPGPGRFVGRMRVVQRVGARGFFFAGQSAQHMTGAPRAHLCRGRRPLGRARGALCRRGYGCRIGGHYLAFRSHASGLGGLAGARGRAPASHLNLNGLAAATHTSA